MIGIFHGDGFSADHGPKTDDTKQAVVFAKMAVPSNEEFANFPVQEVKSSKRQTLLAHVANQSRMVWNIEAAFGTLEEAAKVASVDLICSVETESAVE